MDLLQRMRAGIDKLQSNAQQTVTAERQGDRSAIEIRPANPEVIYVPYYNPEYIRGPPLYGYYPAWGYPGFGVSLGFGFGHGIYIGGFFGGLASGWLGVGTELVPLFDPSKSLLFQSLRFRRVRISSWQHLGAQSWASARSPLFEQYAQSTLRRSFDDAWRIECRAQVWKTILCSASRGVESLTARRALPAIVRNAAHRSSPAFSGSSGYRTNPSSSGSSSGNRTVPSYRSTPSYGNSNGFRTSPSYSGNRTVPSYRSSPSYGNSNGFRSSPSNGGCRQSQAIFHFHEQRF